MSLGRRLIFQSLRYHARSHFGTFLGVVVATAVLVGALAVGDCVRQSLRDMQADRLGKVEFALASQDRFFRADLAGELGEKGKTAPVLQLAGAAANADGSARANKVQILGVDDRFWSLANKPATVSSGPADSVVINTALATQLGVKVGDTILLRVQKPTFLPADAPLAHRNTSAGIRWPVRAIVADAEFGAFGLQANQVPPCNVFVPLSLLQSKLELAGKANLLLVAQGQATNATQLAATLRKHFQLKDAELDLRSSGNGLELITGRVFIDPAIVQAATNVITAEPVSTYFVNELRVGDKTTPYSMVTAMGNSVVPSDMRDDEIIINQWTADDLQAKPGDSLQLTYYVLGQTRHLEEKHDRFRISAIVPLEGAAADRTLMPEFPGIAKAEKTENWDAGIPLDMKKIRPKDEKYWKDYRGTPKAFVTLAAGKRMWGNRFGDETAIRFPSSATNGLAEHILTSIDPATLGFVFQPVGKRATAASNQSEDFGGLFIGFSFFLIVAALILLALLFQFGVEKRATEVGTLLALGLPPRQVRRYLLCEGAAVAVAGGVIGVIGGVAYAWAILRGLTTIWRAAVGTSALHFHVTAETLFSGAIMALVMSVGVIWMTLRKQGKRPARELLEQGSELEQEPAPKRRWAGWIAIVSGVGALAMVGEALRQHDTSAVESFFGAGALLLIAGLAGAGVWLRSLVVGASKLTLTNLAVRGCARRRKRSLATIALLASGCFLIVAVEANKLDATQNARDRASGTGGFALIGESALPIVQDLNTAAGREFFSLEDLPGVDFVPLRVREGDDASCLNLNRAQTPRLLGVHPEFMQTRKAFTFAKTLVPSAEPWGLLKGVTGDGIIPAIADDASIVWALGKKVGDTLDYTDERGHTFKVKLVGALANSILQGSLIIEEAAFVDRFPGTSGYRMFLIDAPATNTAAVSAELTRAMQDYGLQVTPASQRLDAFNAVQNTYLNTFQILGGLGLLLGSAGLGVVVLRNVLERRAESAVMLAIGFKRPALQQFVFNEHAALLVLGLGIGVASALIAVLPALIAPTARIGWVGLGVTLGLVFASGLFWTWLAARVALRGEVLEALRGE